MTDQMLYLIAAVIVLLLLLLLARVIFSVPAILRYFKAMIRLLALTAQKQGVAPEEINKILRRAEGEEK